MTDAPANQKMDRGTEALKTHLGSATTVMDIRQTRRGFCQDLLGCEAKSEFKYFIGENNQVAQSLEESGCCARIFCTQCYNWKAEVKELGTNAELLTVERPCACPYHRCKCCCYQSANVTSAGQELGSVKETCYFCVPSFKMYDEKRQHVYTMHPPTCCGGMCVNCCAEGNPCGRGCCKVSFRIFTSDQKKTDGDAPYVGKILKSPKSVMTELLTEADAFEVTFPADATTSQKAVLVGAALFFNSLFFEGSDD